MVDGPDEVHMLQLGRAENKKGSAALAKINGQKAKSLELAKKYGVSSLDNLMLNRVSTKSTKL